MAEVGLVASLLGIASFGVQLSTSLYRFGSNVTNAREQTDYIARHVTLYSDVLELLAQRIDDDEPIHSHKALNLVDEIYDQSYDLFDKIEDLLPDRRDKINFVQKIKWNFKKIKVDLLVAEIEYLKSTVNLLVSILYAGKKIRSYNRKQKSKKAEVAANVQFARAQNAIVEQVNATTAKENLQASVEKDEQNALEEATGNKGERTSSALIKQETKIQQITGNTAIIRFKQSLGQARDLSEERGLVVQNSLSLVQELLEQWTTLAEARNEVNADDAETTSTRGHDDVAPGRTESPATSSANPNVALGDGFLGRARPTRNEDDEKKDASWSQERIKELEAELAKLKSGTRSFHISTKDAAGFEFPPPNEEDSTFTSFGGEETEKDRKKRQSTLDESLAETTPATQKVNPAQEQNIGEVASRGLTTGDEFPEVPPKIEYEWVPSTKKSKKDKKKKRQSTFAEPFPDPSPAMQEVDLTQEQNTSEVAPRDLPGKDEFLEVLATIEDEWDIPILKKSKKDKKKKRQSTFDETFTDPEAGKAAVPPVPASTSIEENVAEASEPTGSRYEPGHASDEPEATNEVRRHSGAGFSAAAPPKGILKQPRETPFPEPSTVFREGVKPLNDVSRNGIPPGARWTKINRALVNPEALLKAGERFEEREDCVIILRVVAKDEVLKLAEETKKIREDRDPGWYGELGKRGSAKEETRRFSDEGTEQFIGSRQPAKYAGGGGERTALFEDSLKTSTNYGDRPENGPFGRASTRSESAPHNRNVSFESRDTRAQTYSSSDDEFFVPKTPPTKKSAPKSTRSDEPKSMSARFAERYDSSDDRFYVREEPSKKSTSTSARSDEPKRMSARLGELAGTWLTQQMKDKERREQNGPRRSQ